MPALSEGNADARRYPPSIVPFTALAENAPSSALLTLAAPGEVMAIVEKERADIPAGVSLVSEGALVQMVADRPFERISDDRIEPLTEADAAAMLELATLTKPGPFTLRAQALGTFWGIKHDGRLVAMAGQRMRQPGFGELSGLCTHPDFQGRGFGKLLFRHVAGEISARGEKAYLHAYATNEPAIALYKVLGFSLRTTLHVTILKRDATV